MENVIFCAMSWQTQKTYFFFRSSRPEVFFKKVLLKISQNSQENTWVGASFFY